MPGALPAMLKRLLRQPLPQAVLARLVGTYLGFALRTTRWTLDGAENVAPHALGAPAIIAVWHERLSMMPMEWLMIRRWDRGNRPAVRMHVLVSQSRHGRLIARALRPFGMEAVFGSSSRGGAASTRSLLKYIAGGGLVGITPDGPRGPRRRAADGAAQLAALSGVPVIPCSAQTSPRWTLRSWDRMVIPRPFGRGVIVCGRAITVGRQDWREATVAIEAALTDATDRADRLCAAA